MGISIQDFLRKINSSLTIFDVVSFGLTTLVIIIFLLYTDAENKELMQEVTYTEGTSTPLVVSHSGTMPFGSINGTTYTFSWCQGASRTLERNRIYFGSEEEAKSSGRTLSKLCK